MKQKQLFSEEIETFSPELDKMLNKVEKIYQNNLDLDEFVIHRRWGEVVRYSYQNELTIGNIQRLIQFGIKFRELKGPGRNTIEENFFIILVNAAAPYTNNIPFDKPPFPIERDKIGIITKRETRKRLEIFLEIEKFALDSYNYKRDRDSFGGKRRAFSLDIFRNLLNYFQCPELLALAKKSLKSKSRDELYSAFEFLTSYYTSQDVEMEDEVFEQLIKISKKTKSRSVAVGALSVLVDTEQIDEFEALDRIDEWKEKNYYS